MTQDEALTWLQQVNGHLYRTPRSRGSPEAWVALVRTPRSGTRNPKLIIAVGGTMQEATKAAEEQWQVVWDDLSDIN